MKQVIGRIDKADFPTLDLYGIAIKVDTGAYTSSIHCKNAKEIDGVLHCQFLDNEHPDYNGKHITFSDYKTTRVKSSNGQVQKRYKIKTKMVLFGKTYTIKLTLSDRKEMKFPVLLGRQFLTNKFIVDTSLSNVSYQHQSNNEH